MKKTTLILLAALTAAAQAQAQHEVSAYGMGGYSALLYKASSVLASGGTGGGFGIGYTYSLHKSWSISTGVEVLFAGAQADALHLNGSFKTTAPEPSGTEVDLLFNSSYTSYEERQRATFLNIPIVGQWHTNGYGEGFDFYAQAGFKLGVGVGGSYRIAADRLVTTGSIPDWLATLPNNPNHNFGTKTKVSGGGDLSLGFNLALAAEGGVKWLLNEQWAIYTGFYADYGLLNVAPAAEGALVAVPVDRPAAFTHNSLLTATTSGTRYVDRINLLTVGVKIKVAFGF
jgi:hypothetical protein